MNLLVSIIESLSYFLSMILIQSNLRVKRKKFFSLAFIIFVTLDLFLYKNSYIGFISLIVSIFMIESLAFKSSNFKAVLNTGLIFTFSFISRIVISCYILLFEKRNVFNEITNGFNSIEPIILSFILFFLIIIVERHLVKKIKYSNSVSKKYYAKLVIIDSIFLLPMFYVLNRLYRYLIRHLDELLLIDGLTYIFLLFLIIIIFISIFFIYVINMFLLSSREMSLMINEASYDELTQVFNRKFGMKKIKQVYEESKLTNNNFVVCFLDVNNLKLVNDRFGHPEGDELIKTVSLIIKNSLRDIDFMVRYGGDEFIVIFRNCTIDDAKNAWKRIRTKFEMINYKSNKPYRISVSAGFASMDEHPDFNEEELIDISDVRMYKNKRIFKSQTTG